MNNAPETFATIAEVAGVSARRRWRSLAPGPGWSASVWLKT